MPSSCCAINCANRSSDTSSLVFYSIPTEKKNLNQRKLWINAIRRKGWSEHQINNARLCSAHFISGKKSNDPSNPDYVPSLFSFSTTSEEGSHQKLARHERYSSRKSSISTVPDNSDNDDMEMMDIDFADHDFETDADTIERLQAELDTLKEENTKIQSELEKTKEMLVAAQNDSLARMSESLLLKKKNESLSKCKLTYKYVRKSKAKHHFYTGVSVNVFKWLFRYLKTKVKRISRKISYRDHLLLLLMKLRLGVKNRDLAYRFNITFGMVSKVFRTWIVALSDLLGDHIYWPEKPALRKHLPKCFRKHYQRCVCIIDCTEIFIERPLNLNARAQTWSSYKNNNTIKYLIACTPTGAVSFISDGWGGRVSDKEITTKSGFLEYIETGDQVLADRGFTIEMEVATRGGILEIPAFTKGKKQLSAAEVDTSRQIANVRIHVERVIGRLRKFNILNTIIPISQVDLLDEIMVTVAGLVNLCPKIVS